MSSMEPGTAFSLLYDQLKYFHDGLYEGGYKVVGSLLLILGRIVTSEKARSALRRSTVARWCGAAAIFVSCLGYGLLTRLFEGKIGGDRADA
jgi:hypothetical protein